LKQIAKPEIKSSYASFHRLFYSDPPSTIQQTSYTYKSLVQSIDDFGDITDHKMYVVVFPNGIHTSQATFNALTAKMGGQLLEYLLPTNAIYPKKKLILT
jgi:hypothetical protein